MTKMINGKALYLDPILIIALRNKKEPYDSWNGYIARECGITKKDLDQILETKEGQDAIKKVAARRERIKCGKTITTSNILFK